MLILHDMQLFFKILYYNSYNRWFWINCRLSKISFCFLNCSLFIFFKLYLLLSDMIRLFIPQEWAVIFLKVKFDKDDFKRFFLFVLVSWYSRISIIYRRKPNSFTAAWYQWHVCSSIKILLSLFNFWNYSPWNFDW